MFLLLRALPGMIGVDFEEGKWGRGFTTLQGVEPWKASWQWVQKSKRQLRRVHVALWASAKCVAGEPQRLHGRRDSCCFRLLAAWTEEQNTSMFVKARVQRVKRTFMHFPVWIWFPFHCMHEQFHSTAPISKTFVDITLCFKKFFSFWGNLQIKIDSCSPNFYTNAHLHVFVETCTMGVGRAALLWGSRPSVDPAARSGWGRGWRWSAWWSQGLHAGQHHPGHSYISCQTAARLSQRAPWLLKKKNNNKKG